MPMTPAATERVRTLSQFDAIEQPPEANGSASQIDAQRRAPLHVANAASVSTQPLPGRASIDGPLRRAEPAPFVARAGADPSEAALYAQPVYQAALQQLDPLVQQFLTALMRDDDPRPSLARIYDQVEDVTFEVCHLHPDIKFLSVAARLHDLIPPLPERARAKLIETARELRTDVMDFSVDDYRWVLVVADLVARSYTPERDA